MRVPERENPQSNPTPRILDQSPLPSGVALMPDRRGRRGEIYSLYTEDRRIYLPGVLFGVMMTGAIVLASLGLKWAWMALHIPLPVR